jgi:hypothetical protein
MEKGARALSFVSAIVMRIAYANAPPSSLMDLAANPNKKITEGEGVGARSLAHNTSGVEGRAGALRCD